jgi:small subunit ribosomal protein S2
MQQLLQAGMHFGHQTRRWNPKMRRYIWGERAGIYIIDLVQTQQALNDAANYVGSIAGKGGKVLFVGTKKQAQDAIQVCAEDTGQPYVNHRWLGGLLTNWRTISDRLKHMQELRNQRDEGQLALLGRKERTMREKQLVKLEQSLGGMAGVERLPDAVVVIDVNAEMLAVKEARRCGIPVIALVDTNCDPEVVDYVVPGNDDAIRSCSLFLTALADALKDGKTMVSVAEMEAGDDAEAEEATTVNEPVGAGVGAGEGA